MSLTNVISAGRTYPLRASLPDGWTPQARNEPVGELLVNQLIGTFDTLFEEWELSYLIKPIATQTGYNNMIHVGLASAAVAGPGDRTPETFFRPNSFEVRVVGMKRFDPVFNAQTDLHVKDSGFSIPQGQFSEITVARKQIGGVWNFICHVAGTKILEEPTTDAVLSNVEVRYGNTFSTANAEIANFRITTTLPG